MNRRRFLHTTASGLAAASLAGLTPPGASKPAPPVGVCDWSIGHAADPTALAAAAQAGLDGVQISVGTSPESIPLRDPAVRRTYLDLMSEHDVRIPSVAAGGILNQIPLKSEPQAAVYVIDAVEAAAALGAENILMAFFGNGDLRLRDAAGDFRNLSDGPFAEYELDTQGVTRVVEALRQIAPRAEAAGVVLGLENTVTARQNLEIIDRVGSDHLRVYYDTGNSQAYGYDVPGEIRRLGNEMICEMHVKETLSLGDPMTPVLGGPSEGGVDFGAVARAVAEIGYDGWLVIESGGRGGSELQDTRANVAFVRRMFG